MPTLEVEFEVFCSTCGKGLCHAAQTGNRSYRNVPFVSVEPCEDCMQRNYDKGYDDGYAEGESNDD